MALGNMSTLATCWIAFSAFIGIFARFTAILPVNEPVRSAMIAQANVNSFQIFIVLASPALLVLAGAALWKVVKH